MPRDLPTGLIALLKSGFAETHSTLAISLLGQGRSVKNIIYLATAAEGGSSGPPTGAPAASAITIPNHGFETPILGAPGYEYAPAGSSWTMSGCGIIQGSLFGAAPAYEGIQGAFVSLTGYMLQTLTGFIGGTNYELRFHAAQQIPGQVTHDFDVYLDATLLGHVVPSSAAFELITLPFTAGQSSYTLKFQGVNTAGASVSSIIDDVQIVPASGGISRPPGRGVAYQPRLRQTGPVAMSLTRSADRVDVVVENIDRLAGSQFVAIQDELYGSFAEFGRIWRDLRNPANSYQITLLTGQVIAARASESEVQLTLVSDIYASGAIAGQIVYGRSCPWTFKDPATCAFVGPEATCNKLLDDPGGCSGRSNEHHFGGFPYIKSVDTISDPAAIQKNVQYQTIIQPASLTADELAAGARATTAIIQRHNLLLQGFTVTDDAVNDATKIVAGGVGGANYQTLKENDGYSYVRTLPPQPTLNFLNAFKLTDDPGNLETDISTYGVPTGQLNVRTDFKASGSIDVANVVSYNISGIVTLDAVLNLQPGMGILVEGAGVGGADFIGTIGAVSADWKTYVLTAGFPTAPPSGARVQADDTAAVQAWITAHGDLAMPPGYYRLTSSIIVPTTSEGFAVVIHGSGWDLSVFAFQHHGDGFIPTAPDLKIDSLVFEDLTIGTGTKWNASGLLDAASRGYGLRMTAPGYLGIYNNFVLNRCRVIGWGAFGVWSDNMEVSWITNCIFRENRFGHVAFVAPDQAETAKLPNANVLRSNAFDQAYGGGDSDRTASGSMTQPPASPTPAQTDAARAISISGVSLTAADRGRAVIVHGAGTNNSNLYSFIDVVLTGSTAKLAHAAQTTVGGATVEILSSSIASIYLNRAHDTILDGGTIQGNFTTALPSTECNAIRADECFNLRIVGVHEEDAGGNGGSAVRLANCIGVNIENWGGTSAGPGLTNAHNADFQLINTHGVSVRNSFFNDRPQFVIDDTSSEVQIDDSWIVGYNNLWQADRSWDRLRIGSGVRTAQTAESRTAQLAGNEYSYDGFFGRDLVLNGQFLDGSDGFESWTKATGYISRTANSPFQGGTFINVDATGVADAGGTPVLVLEQLVAIPDVVGPGLFTLGFNWNLDFQGGTEQTGRFMEVRLHPSSGVDEAIQWSTRPFPVVQDTWQVGHVRCFLGTGTGRTIAIRINVTQGPNNVSMHFANFRLAAGKHIFGSWERAIHDFGGRMRAPLEFAPITNPPYPPPPPGSPYLSIVNIAGVLNLGKNGAYTPLTTTGSSGPILGPPGYYAVFKGPDGTSLDYASLKQETTGSGIVHVLNVPLWIDRQRALISDYTSSGLKATIAICDYDDVVYFGPDFNAAGAQSGSNVVIRAAHGDISSLQISGSGRRMTFNSDLALAGVTPPLPTFFVGISDLALDGLRIQQTTAGLYVGYMLSCFFSGTATDALFAVDQKGGLARLNNLSYNQWPINHGPGGTAVLTNNGSGTLTWAPATSSGHVIQEESTILPARPALNFVGLGFQAADIPPPDANPRTNVTLFQASVMQEGVVTTGIQDFGGRKHLRSGMTAYDNGLPPLVAQYTGGTTNASIQEWWISGNSTPLALLNTQPTLRLGIPGPGGRAGFLELCFDVNSGTTKLSAGQNQGVSYTLYFPNTAPVIGSTLQVLNAGGQLTWSAAGTSGHVILEEGVSIAQRAGLNFQGAGLTAVDDGTNSVIKLNAATATLEGIVSSIGQTFGGRKTFNAGATMLGLASTVPVLTVALAVGASPTGRLQEWQDSNGQVLGYVDQTPAFHLGAQGFTTGMLELASASSANFTTLRAATFPASSLIYVLPVVNPTPGQVLGVDTIVGSVINTKWQNSATGAGNVTVTAPQGTDLTVPRWSGTSPTTTLVDSNIIDKTSTVGTIQFTCNQLLFKRLDANDIQDFYQRSGSGAGVIWRVDRRTGSFPPNGMTDQNNTTELQLHFEPTTGGGPNDHPYFVAGDRHFWFQAGVRVRPLSSNTATVGNAFEVQEVSTGNVKFAVEQNGNLQYVYGVPYVWPNAAAPAGSTYLRNDGTGHLFWTAIATGAAHVIYEETTPLAQRANLKFQGAAITASDNGTDTLVQLNAATTTTDGIVNTVSQTYAGRKTFNQGATMLGIASIEPVLTTQLSSGAGSGARIQEWRDIAGNYLGYFNSTPALRVGSPSFYTGMLELCSSQSSNYSVLRAADFPVAALVYVWPANTPVNNQVLGVSSVSGVTVNLAWQTGGSGSGANIQLSNLDNSGSAVTPSTSINTHLGFSVDGGWNIGAPAHRVGSMYLLGTFFMYPAGSTNPSSPKAFGFLDPQVGEYTKVLLSGNAHICQGGNGQRLQFTSYHSFEFRGNRRNNGLGTPLGFTTISGTDSSSFLVYLDRSAGAPDSIPLLVNTDTAAAQITSDLFVCQNAGTTKFQVGGQGTIIAQGGTRFRAKEIQPGGAGGTTAVSSLWRTIIVDTWFGYHTLTLPSAQLNPGMIIDVIHMRAIQSILGLVQGRDQAIYIQTNWLTGGSDVFNAWPTANTQASQFILAYPGTNGLPNPDNQHKMVKLIADESLAIWWLMPYYI
jgi:hypothetical protein